MEPAFKKVDLYGGAITANVPSGFMDVSTIRQVPDHQEVYLSTTGFSSLIFDLGERVTHTNTDEEALRYHFDDIVDEQDSKKIWSVQSVSSGLLILPNLIPDTPVLKLVATTTPPPPTQAHEQPNAGPSRLNEATSVTILMTLIRLEPERTDLVIKYNVPVMPAAEGQDGEEEKGASDEEIDFERGKYGRAVVEGMGVMYEVERSLDVLDWGLFGGEEGKGEGV